MDVSELHGEQELFEKMEEVEDKLIAGDVSFGPIENRPWHMALVPLELP